LRGRRILKESTYKNYLLLVLLVIQAFNYVDGLALGLVLQDIKMDLHLSDAQLGLLTGIAFFLFYSVMGMPIARWADRGNRVTIISLAAAVWSIMVALSGLATNFAQLLLIRIGVAVGEAGCVPPAHSLIADNFTRAERPRAVGIYMLAGSLSTLLGYLLAGWLNEFFGWRAMFMLLSLPGLIPATVAWFTLREPRQRRAAAAALPSDEPSMREVFATLWRNATYRYLLLVFCVTSFFGAGVAQWQPAYFVRSYGLKTGELGTWLTVIYGVGGMLGTYWGGQLASRLAPNREHLQLKFMAVAYCAFGVISVFIYLPVSQRMAFGFTGVAAIASATIIAPLFAIIQTLVPPRMRAMSIAIIYLFGNLLGTGLGPLAAGVLSDALRPLLGQESLRYTLLAMCPGFLVGAWLLWQSSKSVTRDLKVGAA
jgi:predicted MFS family arabinose efflux permease